MRSPAALFLLPFAILTLAGCSDPVDESALNTYKVFAGNVHSGNVEGTRGMLEHKTPPGWTPRVGGPEAPHKNFSIKSVELDRKSCSTHGDTMSLKADVTVVYADRRNGLEVVFMSIFAGGDWFYRDEKMRYTHQATLRKVDGAWKISDFQVTPK